MDRTLNKEILRLALPSILANITVPLVGMVDTSIAGHIEGSAATFIGAISVGAIFFSLLYWSFSFLRSGTGGLTAQAFGRADMREAGRILLRAFLLALGVAVLALACQVPFMRLVSLIIDASPEVRELASRYFFIRIWAAPATLSLMSFRGWFVGMQDSVSSMWVDLLINAVNILASIVFTFGIGGWAGMGFDGIALGTVVAQYCGMLYCVLVCCFKYKKVLKLLKISDLHALFNKSHLASFFKMNADLFVRSLCFIGIYVGYTLIAARFGDLYLSCSSIIMQLLMLFSYFTDGFAYAGEALTGRFIGSGEKVMLRRCVRYVFVWIIALALFFSLVYYLTDRALLSVMTSDESVIAACSAFLPWLLIMPPIGCVTFTWDGIFLGATKSSALRNSMLWAVLAFFGFWFAAKAILGEITDMEFAMHLLLGAYFAHIIVRAVYLTIKYKTSSLA